MTSKNTNLTLIVDSSQTIDGELTKSVTKTECVLYNREGRVSIFYDERDNGMGDTKSSLTYNDGRLTIKRKGSYSSNMIFEQGASVSFAYKTPYGIIPMELTTHRLFVRLIPQFHAHIEYDLITNDQVSQNVIDIHVE